MTFLPPDYQDSLKARYKPSSIKTIDNNVKRIYLEIFNLSSFTNLEPLLDTDKVIEAINAYSTLSIKQNLITAILALLRYPPESVTINPNVLNIYDQYATQIVQDLKDFHVKTEKEKQNWIPWGTVIAKYNHYASLIQPLIGKLPKNKNELLTFQKYIILLLYTQIPPLRCQEYLDACISPRNDIPGKNIIDLSNKKFIVKYHKTIDSHGPKVIDLNDSIISGIKEWQRFNGYRDYLFISPNKNEPMDRLGLLQQFYKIFEPYKIGPAMLRKIYISEILTWDISADERKKIAAIMGHTVETQEFIYRKK